VIKYLKHQRGLKEKKQFVPTLVLIHILEVGKIIQTIKMDLMVIKHIEKYVLNITQKNVAFVDLIILLKSIIWTVTRKIITQII
jgi:hypothetical protein